MRPLVIGICGGTGSGKTMIARRIIEALSGANVALLQQDNYYKDRSNLPAADRDNLNFDHPDAFDSALLAEHIRKLRAGEAVARPNYDFASHNRLQETVEVLPHPALIVDGILIFQSSELRDLMDLKVFVDADADLRFIRRLRRDLEHRGRTVESVIEQYLTTVRQMHLEFVEPSKQFADIIVPEGGKNQAGIDLVVRKIRSLMPPAA